MSPGPSSRADEEHTKHTGATGALSSNEVNFLVYRYLLESGFGHSAFVFGCESDVDRVDVDGKEVPVGALVSFIQKGFQMMEIEANLNANGTDVYGKYVQFTADDILTKDLDDLRCIAKELQEDDDDGEAEKKEPDEGNEAMTNTVLPPIEIVVKDTAEKMDVDDNGAVKEEEEDVKKVDEDSIPPPPPPPPI